MDDKQQHEDASAADDSDDEALHITEITNISKYVEATSGAEFAIKVVVPETFEMPSDALRFKIELDQDFVEGGLCRAAKKKAQRGNWKGIFSGPRRKGKNGWELRPFLFSEIVMGMLNVFPVNHPLMASSVEEPLDGPVRTPRINPASNLGTIVVKVYRESVLGPYIGKRNFKTVALSDSTAEFSEKELKGMNLSRKAKHVALLSFLPPPRRLH